MLSALQCREFALQCVAWGTAVDASQRPGFVATARTWLILARAIERAARELGLAEIEGFRSKLN